MSSVSMRIRRAERAVLERARVLGLDIVQVDGRSFQRDADNDALVLELRVPLRARAVIPGSVLLRLGREELEGLLLEELDTTARELIPLLRGLLDNLERGLADPAVPESVEADQDKTPVETPTGKRAEEDDHKCYPEEVMNGEYRCGICGADKSGGKP